ncbi:MAG: hypothetical protein EOP86_03550 [Verrucomicrobiaceae bacterium]|nr:MAG: hypothetical protein EOP86_03550 [Verrucomicrobiaceae bacterium]
MTWGSIAEAEVSSDQRWLILTLAGYQDVKIILTLEPVDPRSRQLLIRAVTGVLDRRGGQEPKDSGNLTEKANGADRSPRHPVE